MDTYGVDDGFLMGVSQDPDNGQRGGIRAESWQTLQARLASGFELREVRLILEGRSLELTKVANIDTLLDKVSDADRIPFWAEPWPASIGLARFILRREKRFLKRLLPSSGSTAYVTWWRLIRYYRMIGEAFLLISEGLTG